VCALTAEEEALLTTPARPIVLARKRAAAELRTLRRGFPGWASFCPMRRCSICSLPIGRVRALVMTSANLSEEPIAIDNDEARGAAGWRLPMPF
jgi:hydrogenase maturation protein HypF